MNAGEPSGNWCLQGPSTEGGSAGSGFLTSEEIEIVYAKSCSAFWPKMVGSAVHNAFLNTLTVGTPLTRVPAAFQQWEMRSHAFSREMAPVARF